MNRKNIIVWIFVFIVIFLGLYFLSQDNSSVLENEKTEENRNEYAKIYSTSFTDYHGNEVFLSDFESSILVMNSWATWCPFCIKELPDFVLLQEEFGDDIVVIAINRKESLSDAKSYTDNLFISDDLVYLLDSKDEFYRSIGAFSMPETIFTDKEGRVFFHKRGFMSIDEMREVIKKSNLLPENQETEI